MQLDILIDLEATSRSAAYPEVHDIDKSEVIQSKILEDVRLLALDVRKVLLMLKE